ncbi:hypothetical protein KY284_035779 [Solanum tuberosum]|uniref:'chromo' domain containing protein n=1 Tax=Solanum tuberosum TaxID=4113 RepID=M0ZZB4_SOLTU|nr:hypothetical protein KY284_035779 [Solanum tuberosum]
MDDVWLYFQAVVRFVVLCWNSEENNGLEFSGDWFGAQVVAAIYGLEIGNGGVMVFSGGV